MDLVTARQLTGRDGSDGAAALAAAAAEAEPDSLGAASRLRRSFAPDLAAAALTQVGLRRRAVTKFGDRAGELWFTPAGLEQATRPAVAAWRAERIAGLGARTVADLGCGIGADSLAFAAAGLGVRPVERDPVTALFAEQNLGVPVVVGDAEQAELAEDWYAFCDPARRDGSGRVWNVDQFTPSWDFATGLLARPAGACLKLGPALPHRMIPDGVAAIWVSDGGDVVEVSLWSGPGITPGLGAVRLAEGRVEELWADSRRAEVGAPAAYVYEPDGAAIRCGGLGELAARHGLSALAPEIAYLTGPEPVESPWLIRFRVLEDLPWKEKLVRQWVRDHRIGTLEIKKRGIDVDPAALRRRLKPAGSERATILLTPTPAGARCLVVERESDRIWHST
ncbi:THUMP-like domain-containing protein [Granulicoccus phenolivorans]|uniref:THUMP-like domain-containing protein n=1 Tax=Granulicoccus phenolivorans TaxID=266854 RepID=UPI000400FB4E|nr:class I SAM-dependent methyltransferase [Granulicoccus phenolivorans]